MLEIDAFVLKTHKIVLSFDKISFFMTDEWAVKSNKKNRLHFFIPDLITYDVDNIKSCLKAFYL